MGMMRTMDGHARALGGHTGNLCRCLQEPATRYHVHNALLALQRVSAAYANQRGLPTGFVPHPRAVCRARSPTVAAKAPC